MSVQTGQAEWPVTLRRTRNTGARFAFLVIPAIMAVTAGCMPPDEGDGDDIGDCPPMVRTAACGSATAPEAVDKLDRDIGTFNRKFGPGFWVAAVFPSPDAVKLRESLEERVRRIHVEGLVRISDRFGDAAHRGRHGRKYMHLAHRLPYPMPADGKARAGLEQEVTALSGQARDLKICPDGSCFSLQEANSRLSEAADAQTRRGIRAAWAEAAKVLQQPFGTVRRKLNAAARGWGYEDMSDWWTARYEMKESEFVRQLETLSDELAPLTGALRCHMAAELNVPRGTKGPRNLIPADELGTLTGRDWRVLHGRLRENLPEFRDLSLKVEDRFSTVPEMVRWAESTYRSAGFPALPESFWQGSQFTRPERKISGCPRYGTNVDWYRDVRLTMCGERTARDLVWSQGMLAFLYYDLAFSGQDWVFRDPPHLGFHFAHSDMFELALTPEFLHAQGLLEELPSEEETVSRQLHLALRILPQIGYGIAADLWRWQVYGGDLDRAEKRNLWKRLRARYQGVDEGEAADMIAPLAHPVLAGANEMLPRSLGRILQFQFYAEACRSAGHKGPLHRCSFFGSKAVAMRLWPVLKQGSSRPWTEILKSYTGSSQMSAAPLLAYFAPLKNWLDERNRGRECG